MNVKLAVQLLSKSVANAIENNLNYLHLKTVVQQPILYGSLTMYSTFAIAEHWTILVMRNHYAIKISTMLEVWQERAYDNYLIYDFQVES